MIEIDIEDQDILIQEDQMKEEQVTHNFFILHFFYLELFIDNEYEYLMKFSDVLYDSELPNNILAEAKEKKQQKSNLSKMK